MVTDDIDDIPSRWCPDCGDELALAGLQRAGIGQYFGEACRRRHDRYVGQSDASA